MARTVVEDHGAVTAVAGATVVNTASAASS